MNFRNSGDVLADHFNQYYEKAKQHKKLIWFIFAVAALIIIPFTLYYFYNLITVDSLNQVSQFGITNVSEKANIVNQYRSTTIQYITTCAQILGGIVLLAGLYFAWGNLTTAREGQITERFTRAVDQLGALDKDGNPSIEIRLGGIYALERIASESDKDYWSIMEILTAYVRKNSSDQTVNKQATHLIMDNQVNESAKNKVLEIRKVSLDIQAVLTVLGRRKYFVNDGESKSLNLRMTHLKGAHLDWAHLEEAHLDWANLEGVFLDGAHLEGTHLEGADLKGAYLDWSSLKEAYLEGAHLEGADLYFANLKGAHFEEAKHLVINQLSKVRTLCGAKLDDELLTPLKEKHPALFEKPDFKENSRRFMKEKFPNFYQKSD